MSLLTEALVVGIMLVVVGTIVAWPVGRIFGVDLPPVCKDWNRNFSMEISLFLTGALSHLAFEFLGLNAWYCRNGTACKRD